MDPFNSDDSYDHLENYYLPSYSEEYNILNFFSSESDQSPNDQIYESQELKELPQKQAQNYQVDKKIEIQNQPPQDFQQTHSVQEKTKKTFSKPSKNKIIQKICKGDTKKYQKKIQIKLNKSNKLNQKTKTIGNSSKFNNMGGFLIGSLSEILNKNKDFKITNNHYEISISGRWMQLSRIKLGSQNLMISIIKKLKKQIEQLPRKDGAKKHLFRLINTGFKDNEERKQCKRLIRLELLHNLNQENWLTQHVNSRVFQPKGDDVNGTKKKERHEAYLVYLKAIREALITRGQLPKRLNL